MNQTKGKSRGVEDPFGRSPEGSALWWGAGAKPLLAEGETGEVQRGGTAPLWRGAGAKPLLAEGPRCHTIYRRSG